MYESDVELFDGYFFLEGLIDGVILWLLYRSWLFRCLPGWTYARSMGFLVGMQVLLLLLSGVLFRRHRTGGVRRAALLLPVGVYTLLAYQPSVDWRWWGPLAGSAVLAVVYTVLCVGRKVPDPARKGVIIKRRLYRCGWVSWELLGVGAAVLVVGLLGNLLFGVTLLPSTVKPVVGISTEGESQTMKVKLKDLVHLDPDVWETLTSQEKLDTLQVVANIEAHELGLPQELRVGGALLDESTLAEYEEQTHTVSISMDHLENSSAPYVLRSVLHECYHAYQQRLVDAYEDLTDPALRQLKVFRDAAQYAKEFADYKDIDEDDEESYYAYYTQACETDARSYAEDHLYDYYDLLYSALDDLNQSSEEEADSEPDSTAELTEEPAAVSAEAA